MTFDNSFEASEARRAIEVPAELKVPEALQPTHDHMLPELTPEVIAELSNAGWFRVGLMVAIIDSSENILLLRHHESSKIPPDALGPLGETTKAVDDNITIVEQPLETLFRGIQEELGRRNPAKLDFWIHQAGGWVINQWPRGISYPKQYAAAISFPLFIPDRVKEHLLANPPSNEEVKGLEFVPLDEVYQIDDDKLRPGVKPWLKQLDSAGLLRLVPGAAALTKIDFSELYRAALDDLHLQPEIVQPSLPHI